MLIKPTFAANILQGSATAGLAPALTPRTFTMTKPSDDDDDDDDDDGDDDDDEGREGKARWITRPTTATTGTPRPAPWATITGQHYGPARRASTTGQHGHNAGCSW